MVTELPTGYESDRPAPPSYHGRVLRPDLDELIGLLPHRAPFVFVDTVDVYEPGHLVEARYRVTGKEPFLAGHFPGNPVFPGVLQLEALAQTGSMALLADPRYAGKLPLFGGVDAVRFRRVVRPGDEMSLTFTIDRLSSRGGWGHGRTSVEGALCCEGRLMFVMAPGPEEPETAGEAPPT